MTATVFLDVPTAGDEYRLDCEEVRIIGNVAWAVREDERDTVVPMSNVTGVKGDTVEQRVEEIDSPGGLFTELLTELS
jgi:hypothetical protein